MAGSRKKRPTQHDKFVAKAREIGADEESSAADKLLERLAKTPPDPRRKRDSAQKTRQK